MGKWHFEWIKMSEDCYQTKHGAIAMQAHRGVPAHEVQRMGKGWQIVFKDYEKQNNPDILYATPEEAMKACDPEVTPRVEWEVRHQTVVRVLNPRKAVWKEISSEVYRLKPINGGVPEHEILQTKKGWQITIKNYESQKDSNVFYETYKEAMKACDPKAKHSIKKKTEEVSIPVIEEKKKYGWVKYSKHIYQTDHPGAIAMMARHGVPEHRIQQTPRGWLIVIKNGKKYEGPSMFYSTREKAMEACE